VAEVVKLVDPVAGHQVTAVAVGPRAQERLGKVTLVVLQAMATAWAEAAAQGESEQPALRLEQATAVLVPTLQSRVQL
jgi:hypothetical protein